MEKELLCLSYIFIILIRSAISAPAVTDSTAPGVDLSSTSFNDLFLHNETTAADISDWSQDDLANNSNANLNNSLADELITSKPTDETGASSPLNEIKDNRTSKQKDDTPGNGEATTKTESSSLKTLIALIDKLTKITSESTNPSINTAPSTALWNEKTELSTSATQNETDPGAEQGRSEQISENEVPENSSTLQDKVTFISPVSLEFSTPNSVESENATEILESRHASTDTTDISVPTSSWPSIQDDIKPDNSIVNNPDLAAMSLDAKRNSSLVDKVEFVLAHASNLSDSDFVNDLADMVVSISAMNDTDDFMRTENPESVESKLKNSTEIGEMRSSIDTENEISNSTLEEKSANQNASAKEKIEQITNANISMESNEILDGNSSALLYDGESVMDGIASTAGSNLSEIDSSIAAFPTAVLNLESSTELVELLLTQSAEISSTEWPELAETSNLTEDENLQQRNEISTGISLIKESQVTDEAVEATTEAVATTESAESTTISGEELFSNTPLEYFINSTIITRLDLTTVASIATPQGTPTPSLLELLNRNSPKTTCHHQGREYSTGQHIDQLDPCHFCVCVNGYLDCYWKNCPPPPEGCMELDFDGVCDRSLYLCPIPKKGEPLPFPVNSISRYRRESNYTQMTCDILGVQYKVGELVGVASDPCMECRCALDSLYCSPKCCFQPVESGQDPSKNSRANDAIWQPVLAHPLKHLRYEFENQ